MSSSCSYADDRRQVTSPVRTISGDMISGGQVCMIETMKLQDSPAMAVYSGSVKAVHVSDGDAEDDELGALELE